MTAPAPAMIPPAISPVLAPFVTCDSDDAEAGVPAVAVEFCDTEVASPEVDDTIGAVLVADFTLPFPEDEASTVADGAPEETDVPIVAGVIIGDPSLVEDATTEAVLEAMAEVTIAVPALSQGEITH